MSSLTPEKRTDPPQSDMPRILVAIVNYCTPELVIDCLASLKSIYEEHPRLNVIVADNASPDGSGQVIADAIEHNGWNEWARLLPLPRNGGFSYGNNAIIREYLLEETPPDYFWLLNSDTVVRPGALQPLLNFMSQNSKAGIAGSCLEFPDGTPQHCVFRFHSIAAEIETSANIGLISRLLKRWQVAPPIATQKTQYDWLSGASMFIRTELLQQTGLFDEAYFLYYEETDLCLRAHKLGWECWYIPESRVIHLVGRSTGVTAHQDRPKRRAPFWFESRRRYFVKHHGRIYASLADLALATGTLLWLMRAAIQRRPSLCPEKFLYDLMRHSAVFNVTKAGA